MKIKNLKRILFSTISIVIIASLFFILFPKDEIAQPQIHHIKPVSVAGYYSEYLLEYKDQATPEQCYYLPASMFNLSEGENLTDDYYHWQNNVALSFTLKIEAAGWYLIYFNYQSQSTSPLPAELAISLNGEIPYYEATRITLDNLWQDVSSEAALDRYGNDVALRQKPYYKWQTVPLADSGRLYASGLKFYLEKGINQFAAKKTNGDFYLKEIIVRTEPACPDYEKYLMQHDKVIPTGRWRYEAENTEYKNSSAIIRGTIRDVGVLPFSVTKLKLNVLGIDSYQTPGEAVTWKVDVPQAGYYCLSFKAKQSRQYTTSYRSLYVNGQLPFREADNIPFSYHRNWQNITLSDEKGQPYLFYLKPGDTITLVVSGELFTDISLKLREIAGEITELGLNVTKLTHNNIDKGIDWNMLEYFPDLRSTLDSWIYELKDIKVALRNLYGFKSKAQIIQDINIAIDKIKKIAKNIDELPRRLSLLSQGPASVAQLLANHVDSVCAQPLILDAIFIHDKTSRLPGANGTLFKKLQVNISRFFRSFFDQSYQNKADSDELEVWVNRSRPYVDLIQKVVDDAFTRESGIKVKVSLINNDSKLILANSANRGPDIALGVSAWIPHEYGMRGMLSDLTQFSDFGEVISVYNPEQLVPMIYDDKLFGLPETENFYVLLYRKDILEKLNLAVPDTWDDVIAMLPVLNRYGMSFYLPLSSMSSTKSFDATAPFIFQFSGKLYGDDGFSGAIDDERTIAALTLMTDFYRQYGIPHQIPSFFNSIRQQTVPIGIADFGTYLQLINAAAEIRGLWDITPVPGVKDSPGAVNRSMPGAQQAGIIFKKSTRQQEAWIFLKWWMRTDIQMLFADTMLYTLGSKYLWNSANLEAFSGLNWHEGHKAVILEQWSHLKEVPKIPGSYMVERELSNIWNKVVYDDVNLRSAVSNSLLTINKEINRKMKEFGYLDNAGNKIKEYRIPSTDVVARWLDHE